jgi:RNA polymerase sigma-70 factor, ECF subfamily
MHFGPGGREELALGTQDREQIELCLDGHPEVFREIVGRYQASLLACLAGRLGSLDRAEEVAQESFVRAYLSLSRLRKPESLFPWLLGIANRVILEQQRVEQRQRAAERLRLEQPRPELSHDLALERAISELPEGYQQVVLLRYYGGLSCSEVAERLEIPLGTVTKRLSRAYEMLRESLREEELETKPEVRP